MPRRHDLLQPSRHRDPSRIVAFKVGKGPIDKMIADGGVICGMDGMRHRFTLEEIVPLLGNPIPVDPGQALLEEIARSAGHIKFLESRLVEMDEAELIRNDHLIEEERSGGPGGSYSLRRRENRPEISPWWQLYERERKHFASVCAAAVRSGIEERKIRIAERQADLLEAAFIAAISDLGLDPHDGRVRKVISQRLQLALEGSEPAAPMPRATARIAEPVPSNVIDPVDF